MKIGIYAGSFNPIHNAHLKIAEHIIEKGIVDRVVFVPAGDDYNKKGLIEGAKRYEMIKLVVENNLKLSVSDIEIINKKLYSYQTLDYFKEKYQNDRIYFVMGSDNLNEFHLWKNPEYILENYGIVVFLRNGQKIEDFKKYLEYENIEFLEYNDRLSSTEIRKNIKEGNYDEAASKVDGKVLSYIRENRLYE